MFVIFGAYFNIYGRKTFQFMTHFIILKYLYVCTTNVTENDISCLMKIASGDVDRNKILHRLFFFSIFH